MAQPIKPPPLLASDFGFTISESGIKPLMEDPVSGTLKSWVGEPRPPRPKKPGRSGLLGPSPGPRPLMAEPVFLDPSRLEELGFGGFGFGHLDSNSLMRRWDQQDGMKMSSSFESPPKKAKMSREGRSASFGMKPAPPGSGNFEPEAREDLIKVDKVLTDEKFNVWGLPAKAKVLLISNLHLNVANPRFVSCYIFLLRPVLITVLFK